MFSFPSKAKAHFPPLIILNTLIDNVWPFLFCTHPIFSLVDLSPTTFGQRPVLDFSEYKISVLFQIQFSACEQFSKENEKSSFSNFRSQPQSSASTRNSIGCDNRFSVLFNSSFYHWYNQTFLKHSLI